MARRASDAGRAPEPTVANRWWVDVGGRERDREQAKVRRPAGPVGSRFFESAAGFDQERARERLTDDNQRLILAADPPLGGWAYVGLADNPFPERELDRIKRLVNLPEYARGVVVDCGRTVRLLITGTPPGDRVLDLTLGETVSFDCWVQQEWVEEAVFPDAERALRAFQKLIRKYLAPESIALHESVVARA